MSRIFKILVRVSAMMALASCTPAQIDCAFGNTAGCIATGLGY